jgi:hypothetical protein
MDQDIPRPITMEDLDKLQINGRRELFWDGKRIEVRSRLNLTWPQTLGAILIGLAAIIGGLASGANDGTEFTCRQWQLFCGHQAHGADKNAPQP